MELTWLADTPQSRKRTRALRACPTCQRRKKRCPHLPPRSRWIDDESQSSSHSSFHPRPPHAGDLAVQSPSSTERFVGDLNPEALIREKLDEPTGSPFKGRVGVWLRASSRSQSTSAQDRNETPPPQNKQSITTQLHKRYTSALAACDRLPVSSIEPLTAIYFSKINTIIPLLDKAAFIAAQRDGTVSPFLERSVCLVAAKDPASSAHLRLTENEPPVSSRQFCSEVYHGLNVAMDAILEPDRVTRIRVLALMSLHCEGHEGAEAASLHLCQAIHQAQTIGLHLDRPDRISADPLAQLFWSLWTLDKMHASIGGRAVILDDRDIGASKPRDTEAAGAFGVWLSIADLLATVISYYRPSAEMNSGWEEGFPAFEDIVGADGHVELDIASLGLLELYYHSIAILSCRHKSSENLDSTRISSLRQGLAAVRIQSIVEFEGARDLPPLPIVPYAVSLSMGVSYRQLRSSKLITHFNRAKNSLEACCKLLENLSPYWYSAEAMARLGRKALQQTGRDQVISHPQAPQDPSNQIVPALEGSGSSAHETRLHWEANEAAIPQITDLDTSMNAPEIEDPDASLHGLADIDTIFGEFLDLSLPTNFWDPIFAEQDPSGQ